MSYQYQKKSPEELEALAASILEQVADRRRGCFVDVEGVIEDFGITILPRRGQLHEFAYGYTPRDPRYIVLAEAESSYPPHYRAVAAEEFCHIALEFGIYQRNQPPPGASGHELTDQQRWDIEFDAKYLAGAIHFPKIDFLSKYSHHKESFMAIGGEADRMIREIIKLVSEEFRVSDYRAARRARDLGIITFEEFKRNFADRLQF